MPPKLLVEEWDSSRRAWLDTKAVTGQPRLGTIFKSQGNQRNTYWIRSKNGFFATDSSSWAWLVHALELEGSLGNLAENGDVAWSARIMSLPSSLCRWWLHWGGGCIGIDSQGALLFLGGRAKSIWNGVVNRNVDGFPACTESRAIERRALALKIRRKRQKDGGGQKA